MAYSLATTLYIPANRRDFLEKVFLNKWRCCSICLEDSIRDEEIALALSNLRWFLEKLEKVENRPLILVRPRNLSMAKELCANFPLNKVSGFTLPKFRPDDLAKWWEVLGETPLYWLPTLETAETLDSFAMRELALKLAEPSLREKIAVLRIGGNDLQQILGLRRAKNDTLYAGPLGYTLRMLATTFIPKGLELTAPVCEFLHDKQILNAEIDLDIKQGFSGKTAINPDQLLTIEEAFAVDMAEIEMASAILEEEKAIFQLKGRMCEPATHRLWAEKLFKRAEIYGVKEKKTFIPEEYFGGYESAG